VFISIGKAQQTYPARAGIKALALVGDNASTVADYRRDNPARNEPGATARKSLNGKRLVEQIDQGHLKSIREHDSKEVALICSEKPADPVEIRPAIVRIAVEPPFEEFARGI